MAFTIIIAALTVIAAVFALAMLIGFEAAARALGVFGEPADVPTTEYDAARRQTESFATPNWPYDAE